MVFVLDQLLVHTVKQFLFSEIILEKENMLVCHKATYIAEETTNSCHITHWKTD